MNAPRDFSKYLPNLLGPVDLQADGVSQQVAPAVNFVGFGEGTGYNEETDALDIYAPGIPNPPTLEGLVTLHGPGTQTTNDAKASNYDSNPVSVATTDATPTKLDSFTPAANRTYVCSVLILALKSDKSKAASFSVTATIIDDGGTLTLVGSTTTALHASSGAEAWDAEIALGTGGDEGKVVAMGTGAAATTIRWATMWTRLSVTP